MEVQEAAAEISAAVHHGQLVPHGQADGQREVSSAVLKTLSLPTTSELRSISLASLQRAMDPHQDSSGGRNIVPV